MGENDIRKHQDGRFAYEGLERVFHEKARLGILTSLMANPDGLLFGEIRDLCSLTDGNLSRHLQTLAEARLIEVEKNAAGRRSQTVCRLTPEGLERFRSYLGTLERVVKDTAGLRVSKLGAESTSKTKAHEARPPGWATA